MNTAILGYGAIVPDFLEAVKRVPELNVEEIYGRESSREKVTRFAEAHGIGRVCCDYDELLADESIDVVYVALPNNLHYEYAKKALEHGKDAIVEKPFTGSLVEARDLFDTAGKNGRIVLEAISNQYLPAYKKTKELLPELGDIKLVQINFSQYSHRYDDFKAGVTAPVFDPKQQGGVLGDLNVYNIYFLVGLFGKPDAVHYYANIEKGVDTSGILIMEYPSFLAGCIAAKDCGAPFSISIEGDKGYIYSNTPPNVYSSFSLMLTGGQATSYAPDPDSHRMYYEMLAFADILKERDHDAADRAALMTLDVMEILDEARKQIGLFQGPPL